MSVGNAWGQECRYTLTAMSVCKHTGLSQESPPMYRGECQAPDLPGCISTGKTIEETRQNIQKAIELHLEGMREDGEPIPMPTTHDANVIVNDAVGAWVNVA